MGERGEERRQYKEWRETRVQPRELEGSIEICSRVRWGTEGTTRTAKTPGIWGAPRTQWTLAKMPNSGEIGPEETTFSR